MVYTNSPVSSPTTDTRTPKKIAISCIQQQKLGKYLLLFFNFSGFHSLILSPANEQVLVQSNYNLIWTISKTDFPQHNNGKYLICTPLPTDVSLASGMKFYTAN
jgi:hypothetical protein